MKEQHMKICFNVGGYVKQDILITDETYTPERIIAGLQDGSISTSIEPDGEVVDMTSGVWKSIGKVIDLEAETEYTDYDMDDSYELAVAESKSFNMSRIALGAAVGEVIGDTGERTCEDVIFLLGRAGNGLATNTGLDIVEQYELLTGLQLFKEIDNIRRGFESMMKVAYDAGKDGKEII